MVSATNAYPRMSNVNARTNKSAKKIKDCTTCEHETGYICGHDLEGTKKHDKMVKNELECHSFRTYKKINNKPKKE